MASRPAFALTGRRRRGALLFLSLILALAILRLCLAFIVRTAANHVLGHMGHYRGHISDVGLSLWRGAYQFEGVKIEGMDGQVPVPLFSAEAIDIGLQWRALFHRRIVASVVMLRPRVKFVAGPAKAQTQTGQEEDWARVMQGLVPIKINHFEVRDGLAHFGDPYRQPPVDVHLDDVQASLDGLRTRRGPQGSGLPCSLSVTARLMGDARLDLRLRLDAFAEKPTFDYAAILQKADLTALNPLLRRYVGLDVARGTLSIYTEGKADEGHFKGYVKPLIQGLKVMKPDEKLDKKLLKKAMVGLVAWLFKNHSRDLDATKVPLEGELSGGPKAKVIPAVLALLRNAFISPLPAKLDHDTDLHEFKE